LMLPPDPSVLADMPYFEFHPFGIERRRADVIRRVCAAAERLEESTDLDADEACRRLAGVSGVGPWSSAYCRRIAHGDPDAVIVGDYNLPGVVDWVLAGERTADDARMLELLEPFRGQRGRAMVVIEASGIRPRRRAARSRAYLIERI
ncbi:MAG: hypothetical protein QOH90_1339, partial [Actinomycetota bacterium]|nr:hypothetical protein [Actinomycetota bacterium]